MPNTNQLKCLGIEKWNCTLLMRIKQSAEYEIWKCWQISHTQTHKLYAFQWLWFTLSAFNSCGKKRVYIWVCFCVQLFIKCQSDWICQLHWSHSHSTRLSKRCQSETECKMKWNETWSDTAKPNSFMCWVSISRINCNYVEYLYSRFDEQIEKTMCAHQYISDSSQWLWHIHRNLFFPYTWFGRLMCIVFASTGRLLSLLRFFDVSVIGTKNEVAFFVWHCITKEARD